MYGTMRIAGSIFGPTFSAGMDGISVAQTGLSQVFSDDPANSDQRDAIRRVVGRVPVVGGMKSLRETVVDVVAGEAESPGSKGGNKKPKVIF